MLEKPRPWWALASLVPFGWATWLGFVIAATTARRAVLWLAAAVFLTIAIATIIWSDGAFIIATWLLGIGASLGLAPTWRRAMRSGTRRSVEGARERLDDRDEARRLAREEPEVAREAGVGRPDVPGAHHAGLVDVNAAPATVLARLPGLDDAAAARIARAREEIDGFRSVEDLGATLDLPADTVEDLRDRTVFLPR